MDTSDPNIFLTLFDAGASFGLLLLWSIIWMILALGPRSFRLRHFTRFYSLTPSLFVVACVGAHLLRIYFFRVSSVQQGGVSTETAAYLQRILRTAAFASVTLAAVIWGIFLLNRSRDLSGSTKQAFASPTPPRLD